MATMLQRQPFGELGSARLQSLISAKNCQNAVTDILASTDNTQKQSIKLGPSIFNPPSKRSYEPTIFEDDSDPDTENVDPALLSTKRSKCNDGKATSSTPHFVLNTEVTPLKPTFPLKPSSTTTPTSSSLKRKVTPPPHPFPSSASLAPAGRSPKHKRVNLLSTRRPSLYKAINPPSTSSTDSLPFSLDAAIRGTLSKSAKPCSSSTSIDKSKPKGWFFTIYEDTPDEEAATLMEHSTLCLDLSSDDENVLARQRDDRGKENIPPPDHVGTNGAVVTGQGELSLGRSSGAGSMTVAAPKPRRSAPLDAMADVGEERSPLGEMAAEDFYAAGLDATSVEIIASEPEAALASEVTATITEPVLSKTPAGSSLSSTAGADDGPGFIIAEDPDEL